MLCILLLLCKMTPSTERREMQHNMIIISHHSHHLLFLLTSSFAIEYILLWLQYTKKSFRWCWWYWYAACLTMKVYLVWFAKRLILILFCLPLDFFHLLVEEYLVAPTHFIVVHSAHIVLQ